MTFTAIDFETAKRHHLVPLASLLLKMVWLSMNFVSLISHQTMYSPFTIKVHGIYPRDTVNAKRLLKYPEIQNDYKIKS
jgi:DNA polymerase-3 subunit epsilon